MWKGSALPSNPVHYSPTNLPFLHFSRLWRGIGGLGFRSLIPFATWRISPGSLS